MGIQTKFIHCYTLEKVQVIKHDIKKLY